MAATTDVDLPRIGTSRHARRTPKTIIDVWQVRHFSTDCSQILFPIWIDVSMELTKSCALPMEMHSSKQRNVAGMEFKLIQKRMDYGPGFTVVKKTSAISFS